MATGDKARFAGRIRSATGRDAKDGGKGLPKLATIEVEHGDGQVVSATALPVGPNVRRDRVELVCEIQAGRFEACPICLGAGATSREHVPPKAFGGSKMTWTCARCNNTFGSRTESSMQDWFDHATRVVFTVGDDPRPVGRGRVHLLWTEAGEFVMFPERGSELPQVSTALASAGAVNMVAHPPVEAEVRNGMLKSAFLAACLHLGGVPNVRSAREIRAELMTVVAARGRTQVVTGPRAAALGFYRTGAGAAGPRLALMKGREPKSRYFVSLAGTILTDWPFPEIDPERRVVI